MLRDTLHRRSSRPVYGCDHLRALRTRTTRMGWNLGIGARWELKKPGCGSLRFAASWPTEGGADR